MHRALLVWHVRRLRRAHCFYLHRPVHRGPLRRGRVYTHFRHVRRCVHCGLLLPRGVVLCNGGAVPRGLILPYRFGRAHIVWLPGPVPRRLVG